MRTLTSSAIQPVGRVRLSIGVAEITVYAEDRRDIAVTLVPASRTDTVAAGLIERAESSAHDDTFSVTVPRPTSGSYGGHTTVIQAGRSVRISGGTVHGVVIGDANGVTIINGQVITGSGTVIDDSAGGAIRATVRVPAGCAVDVNTDMADTVMHGLLGQVTYRAESGDLFVQSTPLLQATCTAGDITAEVAGDATITSTSGDIRVGLTRTAMLSSVSGDVRVTAASGQVNCRAVSGDISVHAVADTDLHATSVSGDIRVTHLPGVSVAARRLKSVSGGVRGPKVVDA